MTVSREGFTALNPYQKREHAAWRVLEYLQRHGSATIKDLEDHLGVTTTAVRQHLGGLQADGYVERRSVHANVGRPFHAYFLTDQARDLFACHCDDLALTLLEEVFHMEGMDRTALLLERVGERLAARYAPSVRSEVLQERVEQLADVLATRGVLTDVALQDDDVILLKAYNCPYHELAQEHRSICEMDANFMRRLLGAEVTLSECMMDGHTGCSFQVCRSD